MDWRKFSTIIGVALAVTIPQAIRAAEGKAAASRLTADEVVKRHLEARGGQQAWSGVESMSLSGKMDVGQGDSVARSMRYAGDPSAKKGKAARASARGDARGDAPTQVQVPFALEQKRPGKSRVEIEFAGKKAIQVFDGTNGWLLRPYLNRDDWEPFTEEQARAYRGNEAFADPLVDAAAHGTIVALESMEKVEGRDAYKLKLTTTEGETRHVWVDATTFLDVRVEGTPRRMDDKMRTVWITQRDFRPVQGVLVPFLLETSVDGYPDRHRVVVEKVAVNPALDDARFSRPRS